MFSNKHINRSTLSVSSFRNVRKSFNYRHSFKVSKDQGMSIEDIIAYSIIGILFFVMACWLFGADFMLPYGPVSIAFFQT